MKTIFHWIISAIAIIITAYLVPSASITLVGAFVLAVVLGIINSFIKPIVKLLALPITILTLGIFSLVINALFILLAAKFVHAFHIGGFWAALWFSIVLFFVDSFFRLLEKK